MEGWDSVILWSPNENLDSAEWIELLRQGVAESIMQMGSASRLVLRSFSLSLPISLLKMGADMHSFPPLSSRRPDFWARPRHVAWHVDVQMYARFVVCCGSMWSMSTCSSVKGGVGYRWNPVDAKVAVKADVVPTPR